MKKKTLLPGVGLLFLCFAYLSFGQNSGDGTVTVVYSPDHPKNTFIPKQSLGAGVDGHEKGEIDLMLKPENIKEMLSTGFKPLTYRLRTELGDEAWHWNPAGKWSDPRRREGYWTSDNSIQKPINVSYGYRLPRRGNTNDQANDDGFSRLDDGNLETFWKSNPYLDEYYTNEPEAQHPQWVVVDLGKEMDVNSIRIVWGKPFAVSYQVDYGSDIGNAYFNPLRRNLWHPFSNGLITNTNGDERTVKVTDETIKARFVRVLLKESSHTAPKNQTDERDRLGFAIREIYVGVVDEKGQFKDLIKHSADNQNQSKMYVSSTDSWHRASDLDTSVEQPGLDRIYKTGLTNNLPALIPVGVVYDSPDNAVTLIQYLKARHYRIEGIEIGEEPDRISPEDFGALYARWAQALRQVEPNISLGGPSFATITPHEKSPDALTEKEWLKRFLIYLDAHHSINTFNFFTFEWYPFDEICDETAPQLAKAPKLLDMSLDGLREILPPGVPIWITEYGYSAFAAKAEVDVEGAILNADIVGQFLTLGGDKAYLYGYEPNEIINELPCTWGNNMLFVMGQKGQIKFRTATYYGARMITQMWAQPSAARLQVYTATSDLLNENNEQLVTAYAIRRPDNKWSLMLLNKDPQKEWKINVRIHNQLSREISLLKLPFQINQFSKAQYEWQAKEENGYPVRNLPPSQTIVTKTGGQKLSLPPYSLTIVKEL